VFIAFQRLALSVSFNFLFIACAFRPTDLFLEHGVAMVTSLREKHQKSTESKVLQALNERRSFNVSEQFNCDGKLAVIQNQHELDLIEEGRKHDL